MDKDGLEITLEALRSQRSSYQQKVEMLDRYIREHEVQLGQASASPAAVTPDGPIPDIIPIGRPKKRHLSTAQREKIRQAALRRWAAAKKTAKKG